MAPVVDMRIQHKSARIFQTVNLVISAYLFIRKFPANLAFTVRDLTAPILTLHERPFPFSDQGTVCFLLLRIRRNFSHRENSKFTHDISSWRKYEEKGLIFSVFLTTSWTILSSRPMLFFNVHAKKLIL